MSRIPEGTDESQWKSDPEADTVDLSDPLIRARGILAAHEQVDSTETTVDLTPAVQQARSDLKRLDQGKGSEPTSAIVVEDRMGEAHAQRVSRERLESLVAAGLKTGGLNDPHMQMRHRQLPEAALIETPPVEDEDLVDGNFDEWLALRR